MLPLISGPPFQLVSNPGCLKRVLLLLYEFVLIVPPPFLNFHCWSAPVRAGERIGQQGSCRSRLEPTTKVGLNMKAPGKALQFPARSARHRCGGLLSVRPLQAAVVAGWLVGCLWS